MFFSRDNLDQHTAFKNLPLQGIGLRAPEHRIAVHTRGQFDGSRLPLVCVPGYFRNMSDFEALAKILDTEQFGHWPVVLIDMLGRGRSSHRKDMSDYSTVTESHDILDVLNALNIHKAVFLGQGHGGQVALSMGLAHTARLGGIILLDSSPVLDTPSLVRTRDNYLLLAKSKRKREFELLAHEVMNRTYPGLATDQIEAAVARTHRFHKRRVRPLFDVALLKRLAKLQFDDTFLPQWQFFEGITEVPMALVRSQLTDQVQRSTFDRMQEIRPDAIIHTIANQGSPALLNQLDEANVIANFCKTCSRAARPQAIVSG